MPQPSPPIGQDAASSSERRAQNSRMRRCAGFSRLQIGRGIGTDELCRARESRRAYPSSYCAAAVGSIAGSAAALRRRVRRTAGASRTAAPIRPFRSSARIETHGDDVKGLADMRGGDHRDLARDRDRKRSPRSGLDCRGGNKRFGRRAQINRRFDVAGLDREPSPPASTAQAATRWTDSTRSPRETLTVSASRASCESVKRARIRRS